MHSIGCWDNFTAHPSLADTLLFGSIVLESDDLDEIDWEFIGGSNNQVQSNFYGKGNTTNYNRVQVSTEG